MSLNVWCLRAVGLLIGDGVGVWMACLILADRLNDVTTSFDAKV